MGERIDFPSVLQGNDLDSLQGAVRREAAGWKQFSDSELVGLIAWHGVDRAREGAAAEMQRRSMATERELVEAIASLERSMTAGSERLAAIESRLADQTDTLITLARETSQQTDKLIRLTWWIIALTVVLGIIAAAQLWLMLVKGA